MPTGYKHHRSAAIGKQIYLLAREGVSKNNVLKQIGISQPVLQRHYAESWSQGVKARAAYAAEKYRAEQDAIAEEYRIAKENGDLDQVPQISASLLPTTGVDPALLVKDERRAVRKPGALAVRADETIKAMLDRGMEMNPAQGQRPGAKFGTPPPENYITAKRIASEANVSFATAQKAIRRYRKSLTPEDEVSAASVQANLSRKELEEHQEELERVELMQPSKQEPMVVRMAYQGFTISQCAELFGVTVDKFKQLYQKQFTKGHEMRKAAAKPPRRSPGSKIHVWDKKIAQQVQRMTMLDIPVNHMAAILKMSKATLQHHYKEELKTARVLLRQLALSALVKAMEQGSVKAAQLVLQREDPSWSNHQRIDMNQNVRSEVVQYELPKKKEPEPKDMEPTAEEIEAAENVVKFKKAGSDIS